jgi:hypothetical protein
MSTIAVLEGVIIFWKIAIIINIIITTIMFSGIIFNPYAAIQVI